MKTTRILAAVVILATGLVGGVSADLIITIVPDLTGMNETEARAAISSAGLAVGAVTQSCQNTVPAGEVRWQHPEAGTVVYLGSYVDFDTSSGPCGGYQVTVCTPSHGTINPSPGPHTYSAGAVIPITATPDTGYGFDAWGMSGGVMTVG